MLCFSVKQASSIFLFFELRKHCDGSGDVNPVPIGSGSEAQLMTVNRPCTLSEGVDLKRELGRVGFGQTMIS